MIKNTTVYSSVLKLLDEIRTEPTNSNYRNYSSYTTDKNLCSMKPRLCYQTKKVQLKLGIKFFLKSFLSPFKNRRY